MRLLEGLEVHWSIILKRLLSKQGVAVKLLTVVCWHRVGTNGRLYELVINARVTWKMMNFLTSWEAFCSKKLAVLRKFRFGPSTSAVCNGQIEAKMNKNAMKPADILGQNINEKKPSDFHFASISDTSYCFVFKALLRSLLTSDWRVILSTCLH